jgi:lipoprotein-anchoring transpeptidase ErfK/SrfK
MRMKRVLLFAGAAGLLLGSASPPPKAPPVALKLAQAPAPQIATVTVPEELIPAPAPTNVASPEPQPTAPPAPAPPLAAAEPPLPSSNGLKVVVSIPEQTAYVLDDGKVVARSPVSTGKRGHETPTGTFRILQKKVHHRSTTYDNAPMPYMQRLTWSGVALHAGALPGYPASHGCIRLPRKFAKKLYGMTSHATLVTVTDRPFRTAKAKNRRAKRQASA